ncbi:MAG: LamG-like jellyroll fold domain-containing protein [Acidimicrobiales bacterium]
MQPSAPGHHSRGHSLGPRLGRIIVATIVVVVAFPVVGLLSAGPAAASTYSSAVLADNPVAYWRLDDSGPIAADSSGKSNSCSSSGLVTWGAPGLVPSDADQAVAFNGSGFLQCPALNLSGSAATLEAWVNASSVSRTSPFTSNIAGSETSSSMFMLRIQSGFPQAVAAISATTIVAQGPKLDLSRTYYLAATFDGGTLTLYENGAQVASVAAPGWLSANSTFDIGSDPTYSGRTWNGSIDEVAAYVTALSPSRIAAHYQTGAPAGRLGVPVAAYPARILADHPRTYWRLAEPAYATLLTANGTYGDCGTSGSPLPAPGALGLLIGDPATATGFGGSGVAACSDIGMNHAPAASLEAWVKATSLPSTWPYIAQVAGVASPNADYFMLRVTNGHPEYVIWTTNNHTVVVTAPQAIDLNATTYLAGTFDGNVARIFVNGVEAASQPATGTLVAAGPFYIGADQFYGRYFNGTVAQVAAYKTSLTASQVTSHFAAAGPVGGPVQSFEHRGSGNPSQCANNSAQATKNPIDTESGNFWHSFVDIAIPCRGLGLSLTRTYNSNAASTTGPFGYGWSFNSGMSLVVNPLTAIISEENASQLTFTQSGSTWVPSAPRTIASLKHNADGTWTLVRDARQTFVFSSTGQLSSMADLNGYTTALTYTAGELTAETDASGRRLRIGWTGPHITTLTDTNVIPNRTVTYQYNDGAGNLTDVVDVNGGHASFAYDTSHRITVMKDPVCYSTPGCAGVENHYDASGRVDGQKDQLGRQTNLAYVGDPTSPSGGTTTITDPKGNVTAVGYAWGVRIYQTRGFATAQAATTRFGYDPATLQPGEITDPNGQVTTQTYDSSGNLLTSTDPLGRTSTMTYNALNEPLTRQDPRGVTTTYVYDPRGNLLSKSTPVCASPPCQSGAPGQATTYAYADIGHPGDVTAITDPESKVWSYRYDSYGDRTSVTDPLGEVTTSTFNADGQMLSATTPLGNVTGCGCASSYTTVYSYVIPGTSTVDEFGDVQTITDPLGHVTTFGYDANRNKTSTIDANGNVSSFVYDAANELTQTRRPGTPQTILSTDYNPDGTIADQRDGKNNATISYGYDSLARVSTITDALNNSVAYTYDANGNRLTRQDPAGNCNTTPKSGCTTYVYDAGNELDAISYSDNTTPNVSAITYDGDGLRAAMTDGTGTSLWVHDSLGRLTSYANGNGAVLRWSYSLRNLPTAVTYPGGHTVTKSYDDAGRMISIKDWLPNPNTTKFSYDSNSNLTAETFPSGSGLVDRFGFNAANQITTVSAIRASTATMFSATYSRDPDGQLTSDTSAPSASNSYKYTPLNQLCYAGSSTSAACSNPPVGAIGYMFDGADNLTKMGTTTQAYNSADRLCFTLGAPSTNTCAAPPAGATTYTYDARGNQTGHRLASGSGTCDTYDQANRITAMIVGTGATCTSPSTVASYSYDGNGLRMAKTVGADTTRFVWDPTSDVALLLQQTSGANTISYLYGPNGLPLEQITASGTALFYSHDQLGSTRLITDATGTSQATYTYDPYGNLTASVGTIHNPLKFAGQYQDSESGHYYLRNRYYDPATAQFLSVDPMVAETGSAYGYVNDNPVNGTDPLGLCWPSWACGVEHAVGGGVTTVARAGVDVVAVVPYATYYASYEAAKGINAVGSDLGPVGSGVSHVVAAPLAIPEALGLGGDIAIDAFKGWAFGGESIYDEGITGYINPLHGFLPGSLKGPQVYLPGLYKDGCGNVHVNFEW